METTLHDIKIHNSKKCFYEYKTRQLISYLEGKQILRQKVLQTVYFPALVAKHRWAQWCEEHLP